MESSSGFEEKGQGFKVEIYVFKTPVSNTYYSQNPEVVVQCNEPEVANNPTVFEKDAKALKDQA
jgi:hypothetical protein